jgi:D-amino peptidase
MEVEMKKFVCAIALIVCASLGEGQTRKLRVFISVDMEGVAGAVSAAQLWPDGMEYQQFRRLMTAEANAAIEGALASGASQIVVADSHGNGLNIVSDELNPQARLIRGWPRPLQMMEGIDETFAAAFLVGYHASASVPYAVRSHTISSARYFSVRLNGQPASEAMLSAAIAGYFGVPVTMVTGDEATIQEVARTIDRKIVGVAVKRGIGYESADNVAPEAARAMIRAGAREALSMVGSVRPFQVKTPVKLEVTFKNIINAELLSYLPNVERVDGATVAFKGRDILEVVHFLSFITEYDSSR